jgi:hypothetical protein
MVLQPTDAAWWPIRIAGAAALILAATAIASPPSPRKPAWHRRLGLLAIAALTAHILLTVTIEPVFWQWLSPAIPLEIVLGLAAAAALLMTLAIRRSRALRLHLGSLRSLGLHRVAGIFACAAAGAHVALIAGTGRAVVLLCSGGIAAILAVGIRSERLTLAVAFVLGTGVATALAVGPLSELRLASLRMSPVDHAGFSHSDHGGIRCTTCHHNFVDRSGSENCITCHKRLTNAESIRVDRLFHAFCGDCHRSEKAAGRKTGPIDHCTGCHAY